MKHSCPSCRKPGISDLAKRWSDRANPATCEFCGGLSHVLASTSGGIGFVGVLILVVSVIIAAGLQTFLVVVPGACLAVAYNIRAWRRAELTPIPKENADAAKAANWFLAGLYALFALFS